MRVGDYVLQIDGLDVNSECEFMLQIAGEPGSLAKVLILPFEKAELMDSMGIDEEEDLVELEVARMQFAPWMLQQYHDFLRDRMHIS